MTAQWLLSWWNLIFVVPFGLALVYLGFYTLTGVSFGDTDADADMDGDVDAHVDVDANAHVDLDADADVHVDVDADVDADADVDSDVDADADTDADVDADADADADSDTDGQAGADSNHGDAASAAGHAPFHMAAMSFLGVGRVPLSLLLMVLLMTWGAAGFISNQLALPRFGHDARVALVSLPVAAIVSVLMTRLVAIVMDRWLPLNGPPVPRRHELLGSVGRALYPVTTQFGIVAVRDPHGDLYHVPCRTDPDGGATVAKGTSVRLVGYNAKDKSFYVTPAASDDGAAAQTPPAA